MSRVALRPLLPCLLAVLSLASPARAGSFLEAVPSDPVRSVQTVGGRLLVNGRPTFLTGIYGPLNDAAGVEWAVSELGVDVVIEPPLDASEAELAARARGRYWTMSRTRPGFAQVARFANTIAVSTLDEPETHGCPAGVCSYPAIAQLPVFANYNGWISWNALWGTEAPEASASDYRAYVASQGRSAIVTQDDYFLSSGLFSVEDAISNSYNYILAQTTAVRAVNPNAVNGMYIETWPTTPGGSRADLAPLFTPRVVVAEAKAAIVGGARLVNWWAKPGATPPAVAAAIRGFTAFVHAHADVFTAPRLALSSYQHAAVKRAGVTLLRDGHDARTIMLMNVTESPVTFTTRFPGLRDQPVVDLSTGRRVSARAGAVTVTIPAQDWWLGTFRVR